MLASSQSSKTCFLRCYRSYFISSHRSSLLSRMTLSVRFQLFCLWKQTKYIIWISVFIVWKSFDRTESNIIDSRELLIVWNLCWIVLFKSIKNVNLFFKRVASSTICPWRPRILCRVTDALSSQRKSYCTWTENPLLVTLFEQKVAPMKLK